MSRNPLVKAVKLFDQLLEAENDVMVEVVGEKALENDKLFDELYDDVKGLILEASCNVAGLSEPERADQLDAMWQEFIAERATASTNLDALPAITDLVQ